MEGMDIKFIFIKNKLTSAWQFDKSWMFGNNNQKNIFTELKCQERLLIL
jgi:hypothetical protein